eukprot:scaffold151530_cov20-Tisochrysis_lutea.AAC.1
MARKASTEEKNRASFHGWFGTFTLDLVTYNGNKLSGHLHFQSAHSRRHQAVRALTLLICSLTSAPSC